MALKLFQVEGGFEDGNISYLSGAGAPGGDTSYQDDANVGSVYEDTVSLAKYRKILAGTGADKWAVAVSASDSSSKEINQVAHGLVAGDWIYADSAGGFAKAQADDANTSDAIGIVDSVADVDNFTMVTAGYSTVADASTNGSALFLDQATAGAHTVTKPSVGVQKNLGFASEGLVFVAIDITIEISADDAPGVPLIITTGVTTIQTADSILVDDKFAAAWMLTVDDDANAKRYTAMIMAGHNGTTLADATQADFQSGFELDFPENDGPLGLAIGVGLSGSGAAQQMDLQVAATNSVTVRARRTSI